MRTRTETVAVIRKALLAWHYDLMMDAQRTSRTLDEKDWTTGAEKIADALEVKQ
jgi:hypothetical protein